MDDVLQRLLDAYERAEQELLAIIARHTLDGIEDEPNVQTWVAQKLRSIKAIRTEIVKVLLELKQLDPAAQDALIKQYLLGGSQYVEGFIVTNEQAVNALVADYMNVLSTTRFQILRQTEDAYRRIIAETATAATMGMDTRIVSARRALARFADEGITGFVAKDGRRWDMRSYVEMSSRTALNNALREGRVRGLEQSGKDLIIISSVPNPSPLCAPYERKVLSVSGKDNRYPSLSEAKAHGLFHPNCRHSFTAYVAGLTTIGETDAEHDDYEVTQELRYAERQTRKWKRRLDVADNDAKQAQAKKKIKEWRDKTKEIASDNNLVYKPNRVSNVQAR